MRLPVLALRAAPGTAVRAVPLLTVLGGVADVRSSDRLGERSAAAVLSTSLEAALVDGAAQLLTLLVQADGGDVEEGALLGLVGLDDVGALDQLGQGEGAIGEAVVGGFADRSSP